MSDITGIFTFEAGDDALSIDADAGRFTVLRDGAPAFTGRCDVAAMRHSARAVEGMEQIATRANFIAGLICMAVAVGKPVKDGGAA